MYDDIRKAIAWTIPTGGGEALAIAVAMAPGMVLPMAAAVPPSCCGASVAAWCCSSSWSGKKALRRRLGWFEELQGGRSRDPESMAAGRAAMGAEV